MGAMSRRGDFYEDDEPIEQVVAAFNRGHKVLTSLPPLMEPRPTSFSYAASLVREFPLRSPFAGIDKPSFDAPLTSAQ